MQIYFLCGLCCIANTIFAQSTLYASHSTTDTAQQVIAMQDYYQQFLQQEGGKQLRYKAAAWTLEKYKDTKEEYGSYLSNLLAEEATIQQEWEQAKCYFLQVVETDYVADSYTEGLLAEEQKIIALRGLRNTALQQKNYQKALDWHQEYVQFCEDGWEYILENNQLKDATWLAGCHQQMGNSEKAIEALAPYVFGTPSSIGYSQIDKQAIDHFVQLLQTKYPKRVYKKMLLNLTNKIYWEERGDQIYFYLQLLDNKIYFPRDGANYPIRMAQNEQLSGQAIAHYQRKLMHSYFYQSLLKKH